VQTWALEARALDLSRCFLDRHWPTHGDAELKGRYDATMESHPRQPPAIITITTCCSLITTTATMSQGSHDA
jgi:hypothetical protein